MARKIANFLSVAFHPLIVPTLIFACIFGVTPVLGRPLSDEALLFILAAIFITTFVIPLCCIGVLRFSSYIPSMTMAQRKERVVPFLFISVFYGITTYMFYAKMQLNMVLIMIMLGITLISFLVAFVTVFWKISAHSAALAGSAGFFMAVMMRFSLNDLLWPLVVSVIIAGAVMSARLYLNVHRPMEVLVGCLIGFTISFGIIFYLI